MRILGEPDLARRLSRNARLKAEAFAWSRVLPEWEGLLAALARGDFVRRSLPGGRMPSNVVERTVAGAAMLLLSPLLCLIGVAIKLGSPRPVLHRARRTGRGGSTFVIFKFRTMVQGADRMGPGATGADDPRVTRVGYLLRNQARRVTAGGERPAGRHESHRAWAGRPSVRRVLQPRPIETPRRETWDHEPCLAALHRRGVGAHGRRLGADICPDHGRGGVARSSGPPGDRAERRGRRVIEPARPRADTQAASVLPVVPVATTRAMLRRDPAPYRRCMAANAVGIVLSTAPRLRRSFWYRRERGSYRPAWSSP
jgi:Bacterial sugar transferase